MVKRHTKPSQASGAGGIAEEAPFVSQISLTWINDNKRTRIGTKKLEDGRRVRFAKRSGSN